MKQTRHFSLRGTIVWLICAMFFLYEFLLRTVIGTFQKPIMDDFGLSSLQFSLLSSTMYLIVFGAMQIPVGLLINRYGLKKSLFFACATCTLGTFGFAMSHSYYMAIFFRMLTGLGSAFGFVGLLVAVFEWMPRLHIALMIGVSQFIGTLGPMMAAGPMGSIAATSGSSWRNVFFVLAGAGIILSLLIYGFVSSKKERVGQFVVLTRPNRTWLSLKRLFSSPQPWLIATFSALVYFLIEYLSENEGQAFLILKGYSPSFASYMITLSWLGYALGCPFLGWIADRLQRRKNLMVVAAVCCVIGFSSILYGPNQYFLMVGFLLLGVGASGSSLGFAMIPEHFSQNYRAMGLSLNNLFMTLFTALNAPIIGGVLDTISTGSPTVSNYETAFSIMLVFISFSIVVPAFFIRETFCKSMVEMTPLTRT